ncbi:MAG: hypothetical protein H7Y04_12180 [Verrucomicrobia bacterium]|nr:hypothetical protein [Cytophagales bacterium]
MDAFQIFIYVVVFIVYVVSQAMKANKNKPKPTSLPQNQKQPTGDAKTFEDLLRELQKPTPQTTVAKRNAQELERFKNQQKEVKPEYSSDLEEERMKQVLADREQTLREIQERRQLTIDQIGKTADQNVDEYVKNYEATPEVENYKTYQGLNVKMGRFDEFSIKKEVEHPIMLIFRNQESLRNAFIISEIFKRKS